ncbi:hypothetical protein CRP01_17850 [Flavilitoribacter nigricans DSM 23189 = NBRC 102662]|uniref:Uncharacterized protein n=1 Tax=Flavilitoribacter nigricans (strain ATCC 23147 / DSM 23189 / NBRC 102662 / NCIMB 1420 / SS-2) TaxID=1122177 RepID=A0A2D0NA71_FLAN2|nr:hypothetical protein CRP01_17850 [Flavilitoribacter nigricans DSM 23189 = NBRC 102662]
MKVEMWKCVEVLGWECVKVLRWVIGQLEVDNELRGSTVLCVVYFQGAWLKNEVIPSDYWLLAENKTDSQR